MNYTSKLAIEIIVVGIGVVILGSVIGFMVGIMGYPKPTLPDECSKYNKYHVMEFTLFLTGVFLHLLFELSGMNLWYMANGAAGELLK